MVAGVAPELNRSRSGSPPGPQGSDSTLALPRICFWGLGESSGRLGLAAARGVWPKGRHGQRGLAIIAFGRPGRRPTSARWTPPAGGDEAARAGLPPGTRGRYVCRRGPPRLPRSRRALPAPPRSRVQRPGAGAHGAAPRTGLLRAAARGSISPRPCLARLLICSRHRVLCSGRPRLIPSPAEGRLGCFRVSAILIKAPNIRAQVLCGCKFSAPLGNHRVREGWITWREYA